MHPDFGILWLSGSVRRRLWVGLCCAAAAVVAAIFLLRENEGEARRAFALAPPEAERPVIHGIAAGAADATERPVEAASPPHQPPARTLGGRHHAAASSHARERSHRSSPGAAWSILW
jgi:hypothetical protein